MNKARITTESITRIDYVAEYVEQFKTAIVKGDYATAREALDKTSVLVKQCKRDVAALKRNIDENGKEYPLFASLGGTELRHQGHGVYYRDAGVWDVETGWRDGKLVVTTDTGPMAHANGEELVEITEAEWEEGNKGYIPSSGLEDDDDYCEADDDIPF